MATSSSSAVHRVAAAAALLLVCSGFGGGDLGLRGVSGKPAPEPEPALFSVGTAHIDMAAARKANSVLFPEVAALVRNPYFRYVKMDLDKPCPFWRDDGKCMSRDCAVRVADDAAIEAEAPWMYKNENLGDVKFPSPPGGQSKAAGLFASCGETSKDFCVLEDETSPNAVYVNLVENPERYTGYSGVSANNIWKAVYEENCFNLKTADPAGPKDPLVPPEDVCLEKQFFYRIISGLHASISVHICSQYLDKASGRWVRNPGCFWARVGNFPDRISNVHLVYAMLLRALDKVAPVLPSLAQCPDAESRALLDSIAQRAHEFAIDESDLFRGPTGPQLVDDVRTKFRNVSRIMDCVSCQKCRLWGKTQVTGIGTALKVLFGIDPQVLAGQVSTVTPPLSRYELVALMNTLNRFAESVHDIEMFTRERDELAAQSPPSHVATPAPLAPPLHILPEPSTPEKLLDASLPYWRYIAAMLSLVPFAMGAVYTFLSTGSPPSPGSVEKPDAKGIMTNGSGLQELLGRGPGMEGPADDQDTDDAMDEYVNGLNNQIEDADVLMAEFSSSGLSSDAEAKRGGMVAGRAVRSQSGKRRTVNDSGSLSSPDRRVSANGRPRSRNGTAGAARRLHLDRGYDASVESSEADPEERRGPSSGRRSKSPAALRQRRKPTH